MLNLPKNTELSKQLPKKAIYAKFLMNSAARERFDADISKIMIVNEISPATTTIPPGKNISSFFVLHISLKTRDYAESNISALSKLIPQHILFVLEYEGESRLAIYETKLICGQWKKTDEQSVELHGLNLDSVWENVVAQIGGITVEDGNTLDEQIAVNEQREKLMKEISALEKKARAEKQPRKKFELVQKINEIKAQLI